MKKLTILPLLLLTLYVQANSLISHGSKIPADILNSKVGVLINIPATEDYLETEQQLIDQLTEMGLKVAVTRKLSFFSFNNTEIADRFNENEVTYVISYFNQGNFFYSFVIDKFTGDKKLTEPKNNKATISAPDQKGLLKKLNNKLKKVEPDNHKIEVNKSQIVRDQNTAIKAYNHYPEDLKSEKLLVLKMLGVFSGLYNEQIDEIFEEYPYEYYFSKYDSVEYYKNNGQKYLLTSDNNISSYRQFVTEKKLTMNHKTNAWEHKNETSMDSGINTMYYPVIINLQTQEFYFMENVRYAKFPDVYKKFIEEIIK